MLYTLVLLDPDSLQLADPLSNNYVASAIKKLDESLVSLLESCAQDSFIILLGIMMSLFTAIWKIIWIFNESEVQVLFKKTSSIHCHSRK
jgi:hypothetical protein